MPRWARVSERTILGTRDPDVARRFARLTAGFPLPARLAIKVATRVAPELAKLPLLLAANPETTGGSGPGRPDPPLTCIPSWEWRGGSADVVIIGSGAGGAVV